MRLIVIAGGIAGLAAARRAHSAAAEAGVALDITVLEASDRLGGKIFTRYDEKTGVPLELGPDSMLAAKPRGRELATELGLGNDLVPPGPLAKRAYLLAGGRLRPLPDGIAMGVPTGIGPLMGCIREGIIGPAAALRAGIEPLLPTTRGDELSVGDFTRKRLGTKVSSRLIAPLVAGVFGASPDEVSMKAAFPQLAGKRSLVLAMARRPKSTGPAFLSVRGGMHRLVDALAKDLQGNGVEILTSTPASGLAYDNREFLVDAGGGRLRAAAVLVAAPSTAAAKLIGGVSPRAADAISGIRYHSSAVALLRYPRGTLGRELDGSGYLVAQDAGDAKAVVAACSWLPSKWPESGWKDDWVRAMVVSQESLERTDDDLKAAVAREVGAAIEATAPAAEIFLHRWAEALPIFEPGHAARVEAAEHALPHGLGIAGAAYRGLGIPDCIQGGENAAERLVLGLRNHL